MRRQTEWRFLIAFLLIGAGILQCGCVRIYVSPPASVSLREPPGMKVSKVITDLRTIGTALEAYNVDYGAYPVTTEKDVTAGTITLTKIERLETQLVNYLRHASPEDPWGRPYLYWSSGKSYLLLSTGSDRTIKDSQSLIDMVAAGSLNRAFAKETRTECLEDEILFSSGQFLRSPDYTTQECNKPPAP